MKLALLTIPFAVAETNGTIEKSLVSGLDARLFSDLVETKRPGLSQSSTLRFWRWLVNYPFDGTPK
jgi:hypothetical protein